MSREVLAPPILHMGKNRSYRVNLVHEDFGGNPVVNQQPGKQEYVEKDLYAEDDDDEDESDCTIEEMPNSMFKLAMHVAPAFYGGVIGFKGATKRRIESETQTDIFVPRSREGGGGNKSEVLTIKGKSRSSVCAARRKINLLVGSLRKRMRPTHFLCVPLNHGEFQEPFLEFKKEILASNMPGITEQIFQTEARMHLTLNTCILLDDTERSKAVELLQSCRQFLTGLKTPFHIKVTGLEIMNDDPSAVRVLYACVEAPELQQFANQAMRSFLQSGWGRDEYGREDVKLHMTVMNSRYRKNINANAAETFDAREILKRFGDFNFGSGYCSEVDLCVLGMPGEERDFYKITGSLKF